MGQSLGAGVWGYWGPGAEAVLAQGLCMCKWWVLPWSPSLWLYLTALPSVCSLCVSTEGPRGLFSALPPTAISAGTAPNGIDIH